MKEKKKCAWCEKELDNNRRKFCNDSCKWRYNDLKKDREKHLPPAKKRNENFFHMIVGSTWNGKGQGRRSGHMVKGAMAAMVRITVEEYAPVNKENVLKHLRGIPGHIPNGVKLCNGKWIPRSSIEAELGIKLINV